MYEIVLFSLKMMASSNLTTNLSIYSCAISNSKFIKMSYYLGNNLRTRLSTDEHSIILSWKSSFLGYVRQSFTLGT